MCTELRKGRLRNAVLPRPSTLTPLGRVFIFHFESWPTAQWKISPDCASFCKEKTASGQTKLFSHLLFKADAWKKWPQKRSQYGPQAEREGVFSLFCFLMNMQMLLRSLWHCFLALHVFSLRLLTYFPIPVDIQYYIPLTNLLLP